VKQLVKFLSLERHEEKLKLKPSSFVGLIIYTYNAEFYVCQFFIKKYSWLLPVRNYTGCKASVTDGVDAKLGRSW